MNLFLQFYLNKSDDDDYYIFAMFSIMRKNMMNTFLYEVLEQKRK